MMSSLAVGVMYALMCRCYRGSCTEFGKNRVALRQRRPDSVIGTTNGALYLDVNIVSAIVIVRFII